MSITAIENSNGTAPAQKQPSADEMRKAAVQFEAILLMQLTSAMNGTGEQSEDSLFGGDGGTDLAKKMFSEQLATTMSQAGGVGLADMIMQKFGGAAKPMTSGKMNNLSTAMAAVKDIKENSAANNLSAENNVSQLINKSAKINPVSREAFTGDPNEAEIISTYADELANQPADEGFMPMMLNGKILNTTRPRIAPVRSAENISVSGETMISTARTGEKVNFQMPVAGRISSDFGTRFHPVDKKLKFHGGIDIAVPKGTPIGAAADGVVKFAGWKGGYGNTVIIEHADGSETLYGHNQKLLVREGQSISAGEQITFSGSTGKSTGPHLHFEVRQNGQVVNPRNFLSNVLPR